MPHRLHSWAPRSIGPAVCSTGTARRFRRLRSRQAGTQSGICAGQWAMPSLVMNQPSLVALTWSQWLPGNDAVHPLGRSMQ